MHYVQKSLKWLDDNNIEYDLADIKTEHPDEETLLVGADLVLAGFRESEWAERLK